MLKLHRQFSVFCLKMIFSLYVELMLVIFNNGNLTKNIGIFFLLMLNFTKKHRKKVNK